MDAGAYAACIAHCNAVLLILATTPDTQFDTTDQVRFDRQGATQAIQAVKRSATQKMGGGAVVLSQPIRHTRDGSENRDW